MDVVILCPCQGTARWAAPKHDLSVTAFLSEVWAGCQSMRRGADESKIWRPMGDRLCSGWLACV